MKEEVILAIEIFQPFAQYRNPFTFYYAQSYPLPPKSTIIGMLQNALNDWYGKREGDEGIKKWWNLKVSIHGGFESVFWNYQQLIKGNIILRNGVLMNKDENGKLLPLYNKGLKPLRSPTYQQELFNGHITIFLKGERDFVEKIKDSLKHPLKVLYLGRSEDVIFLKDLRLITLDEVKSERKERVLWLDYPMYIKQKNFPIKTKRYPIYSIPVKVVFKNDNTSISHKAELNKNTLRDVTFESVIYTSYDYIIRLSKEIYVDVIEYKGKKFKIPKECGWL